MSNKLEHHYALLIGVGECLNPEWSLPVTVNDVKALKEVLVGYCGYLDDNICLICNQEATKDGILRGLDWLKEITDNDSQATVIVYYSGHGWLNKRNYEYNLVPHDFDPDNNLLSAREFNQELEKINTTRLLVIFDCCHAQRIAMSKDEPDELTLPGDYIAKSLPETVIQDFTSDTRKVIFSSSEENQKSWILPNKKMSIYTSHLLEALLGAGGNSGENCVQLVHLKNYLTNKVSETAKKKEIKQTPYFNLNGKNFCIALLDVGEDLSSNELNNRIENNAEKIVQALKEGYFCYAL